MGARTTLTAHGANAGLPQRARRLTRRDDGEAADKEVCGVARPWRIRHKLMLGLGLVVGIIALLLAGTFFGLLSYMAAMKTMTAKLAELHKVDELKEKMDKLWIECTVGVKGDFAGKPPGQQQRDGVDFFRRQHHA